LGTLVVLWPTMLRTKMHEGAPLAARRAMFVLLGGIAVIWAAAALDQQPLIVLAVAVYLTGVGLLVRPMVLITGDKKPGSYATMSAIAALSWLVACLVTLAVLAATADGWAALRESIGILAAPYAAGFAGQILLGALS